MKLTVKLVSFFLVGMALLIGLKGYLAVRRAATAFRSGVEADAKQTGAALEPLMASIWQRGGPEVALRVFRGLTGQNQQVRIRWVWFDAPLDDPFCPSLPLAKRKSPTFGSLVSWLVRDREGNKYVLAYWPVALGGERRGGIEFRQSTAELDVTTRRILYRTLTELGVMIAISGVLISVLGLRLVGQPLQQLIEKTRRIGTGDLTGRVELDTRDELGELAESLNGMCARLKESQERIRAETASRIAAMDQLRHADRLRTVGRLASGVAHELGTPLNVVIGRAGLVVSARLSSEEVVESAKTIKAEAERMAGIIRQLLDFARRNTPQRAVVDLRQVVAQTVELLAAMARKTGVTITRVRDDRPVMARVDAGQIQQVLSNLIVNAIQAMPGGGRVEMGLAERTASPPSGHDGPTGPYCVVSVRDEGQGIPAEDREHLFEPFFTTKDVGEGTGLGLSIAYGIVVEHGGWIDVVSEPGRGSCFFVYLPQELQE